METERLIIKAPELTDLKALQAIYNSPFVQQYNCMKPLTEQTAQQRILADQQNEHVFYLYLKEDQRLIGTVCFEEDELRYGVKALSLSYFLGQADSRKGYMSEALKTLIPYIFQRDQLDVLSCRVFLSNAASLKLVQNMGFHYEGCLKQAIRATSGIVYDDCLFALYKKDIL